VGGWNQLSSHPAAASCLAKAKAPPFPESPSTYGRRGPRSKCAPRSIEGTDRGPRSQTRETEWLARLSFWLMAGCSESPTAMPFGL